MAFVFCPSIPLVLDTLGKSGRWLDYAVEIPEWTRRKSSCDDLASLIEIEEQALVEKFVAHAAVEGFDVAILHRLAGRDVVPFHVMLFAPAQDSIRGELGTVIGHDHPRLATPLDDCDELAGNPSARDRGVGDRCQAFSRHVIDDA